VANIETGNLISGTSGNILSFAGVPSATTFVGQGVGTLCRDTLTGKIYTNTGTAAAPVWTLVGSQV